MEPIVGQLSPSLASGNRRGGLPLGIQATYGSRMTPFPLNPVTGGATARSWRR